MSDILITGGAGFIGSTIQRELLDKGYTVGILDNLYSGRRENIDPRSTFYDVDIRDHHKVRDAVMDCRPEVVFHLAAQANVPRSMKDPQLDIETNIIGTQNLLAASGEAKVRRLVYSNTGGALYGDVPENALPVSEDFPLRAPTSFYGVSKRAAESYIQLYGHQFGLSWASLRYANIYGPNQVSNSHMIAVLTNKLCNGEQPTIFGNGKNTRDYVYIDDVVAANMAAMDSDASDYVNISSREQISNIQAYIQVCKELGIEPNPQYGPPREGDVGSSCLDNTKALKVYGWKPKVPFPEGIKRTVDWQLAQNGMDLSFGGRRK